MDVGPFQKICQTFKRIHFSVYKGNFDNYNCIVSYQHFFIKITLWEICQHCCVQILQFQFKADHNIAELKLHKRTVSIFTIVSMLYIKLTLHEETHTIKYLD